jgi:hypothetical protein
LCRRKLWEAVARDRRDTIARVEAVRVGEAVRCVAQGGGRNARVCKGGQGVTVNPFLIGTFNA